MKAKRREAVEVEWEDASSSSGYYYPEDASAHKLVNCHSIGYLVRKTKVVVVLTSEVFGDGDQRKVSTIPRKMIKGIRELR